VATTNTATVAVQVCVAALLPCISVMSLDITLLMAVRVEMFALTVLCVRPVLCGQVLQLRGWVRGVPSEHLRHEQWRAKVPSSVPRRLPADVCVRMSGVNG
jgi:hypothetical protein